MLRELNTCPCTGWVQLKFFQFFPRAACPKYASNEQLPRYFEELRIRYSGYTISDAFEYKYSFEDVLFNFDKGTMRTAENCLCLS